MYVKSKKMQALAPHTHKKKVTEEIKIFHASCRQETRPPALISVKWEKALIRKKTKKSFAHSTTQLLSRSR